MKGPLFDCYVLAPERTAEVAMAFLDRFLPDRVAQFEACDPSDVLGVPPGTSLRDVASFLELHPSVAYSMYWRHHADDSPVVAMLRSLLMPTSSWVSHPATMTIRSAPTAPLGK